MSQRPPERARPTMREVAAAAGVSKALVSIVFRGAPGASDATRARVFAAAEKLGYRTNRAASLLKLSRTKHLGVTMQVRSAFHAELVEAVQAAADRAGYEIVLSTITPGHSEQRAVETLLDFRCESLVLLGSDLTGTELHRLGEAVPVILVGRRASKGGVDVVRTSESAGQRLVVQHLGALGHRDIVHVDGGPEAIGTERRRGFRAAMRQLQLSEERRQGQSQVQARVIRGGLLESDGRRATEELLSSGRLPTAISAFNDHCALGVIGALGRAGVRVPEDCSVTGYDDSPVAGFAAIGLTTVSQDATAQADCAISAAVDRLDGGRETVTETVLQPHLVVRGTTAPADR